MVEGIIKKIMTTGIEKYAKKYGIPSNHTQIKVADNPNGTVLFTMCNSMKEVEEVSFLQIMDKKMDLFQYEALAVPFIKKSLHIYANETNDDVQNVCAFIMLLKNNSIGVSFYNKFKNGKNVSLTKYLSDLGL